MTLASGPLECLDSSCKFIVEMAQSECLSLALLLSFLLTLQLGVFSIRWTQLNGVPVPVRRPPKLLTSNAACKIT